MSTGRSALRNRVAIAGYGISPVARRSTRPLGALAVETALTAINDAGLTKEDIDGFTTGAILPSAGGQAAVDGVSIVSATWMAEQLGIRPRWASGFQGFGQLPGSVMLAVNAIASGAADYVLLHRALSNPAGRYHENPMTRASWIKPVDSAAWFVGPARPDRARLQRVPPAVRRHARRDGHRRGGASAKRGTHSVGVLA